MSKIYQNENDEMLLLREKNWNQRFVIGKIPKFDAYKDINYLSLGLFKSKLRFEEKRKREEAKIKNNDRLYSANYTKSKSHTKQKIENNFQYNLRKDRFPSMKIYLNNNGNINYKNNKGNISKNSYNYPYQGTLTSYNLAGSNLFKFSPDYKNQQANHNYIDYICEEDPEINDEYNLLKDIWEKLGVTETYINNFLFLLNNKYKNRDELLEMIKGERKQMKQFRVEFMKVLSEINKRENKIKDLKNFIKIYEDILETEKKYEYINEKIAKDSGIVNKEKIEDDIHDCLKSLRIRTINTVNALQRFKNNYSNLFNHKIDLEIIKERYGYNENYLSKLKNDLDFLKDSAINRLYHFSEKGGDPFLLNISDLYGNLKDIKKYKQLNLSDELLSICKKFMFYIEQEDVINMAKQQNRTITNQNLKLNNSYNGINNNYYFGNKNKSNINIINNNYQSKEKIIFNKNYSKINNKKDIKDNLLSANFRGDLEKEKFKLKLQNEYKNVFFNTEDKTDFNINNINNIYNNKSNNINNDLNYKTLKTEENNKYLVPGMTSKQLFKKLEKYGKIKNELFPATNKDKLKEKVKNSIIQKIEDRMKNVELEFKVKMEEKFRKEENKLKEEKEKIKIEKEKIEKLCIEEEKERQKIEEKYLLFEKKIDERKKQAKKRNEENEKFEKREKDLFVKEIQSKFLNEVDERFKKEDLKQINIKKEILNEAEMNEKKRKQEIDKIRHDEFEKIKKGEIVVDLREKKKKDKKKNETSEKTETNNNKEENEEEEEDEEGDEEEEEEEDDEDEESSKKKKKSKNKITSENDDYTSSANNKKESGNKKSNNSDDNISEDIEEET